MALAGIPDDKVADAIAAVRAVNAQRRSLWSEVLPHARQHLDRLAGQFRLSVVSNSDGRVEQQLIEEGLADPFEFIVDSTVVGVEKPDPRIFEICLERLGLRAGQCLYVGDTMTFDVRGAAAAGMPCCHYDRLRLYGPPGEGLRRITDLGELP
jgi:putative hydrolase of the HAD superfamily